MVRHWFLGRDSEDKAFCCVWGREQAAGWISGTLKGLCLRLVLENRGILMEMRIRREELEGRSQRRTKKSQMSVDFCSAVLLVCEETMVDI